jgi:DNA-directed RNA polymerase subunit N (RpoN/RPB10)
MIYLLCPTCKKMLGDKQEQYDKIIGQVCKDVDSGRFTPEKGDELKKKFVTSININRYCCTPRIISYKELIKIVK